MSWTAHRRDRNIANSWGARLSRGSFDQDPRLIRFRVYFLELMLRDFRHVGALCIDDIDVHRTAEYPTYPMLLGQSHLNHGSRLLFSLLCLLPHCLERIELILDGYLSKRRRFDLNGGTFNCDVPKYVSSCV